MSYDRAALAKSLRAPLTEALRATLERHISKRSNLTVEQQVPRFRAIAVTGSMRAPQGWVADRLERVLRPYTGRSFHWYVGSNGDTDEAILRYLIAAGEESITVVGYTSYDISPGILSLLEQHRHIAFVDATREQSLS